MCDFIISLKEALYFFNIFFADVLISCISLGVQSDLALKI